MRCKDLNEERTFIQDGTDLDTEAEGKSPELGELTMVLLLWSILAELHALVQTSGWVHSAGSGSHRGFLSRELI